MDLLLLLPWDVIELILTYVDDVSTLICCAQCCHRMRHLITQRHLLESAFQTAYPKGKIYDFSPPVTPATPNSSEVVLLTVGMATGGLGAGNTSLVFRWKGRDAARMAEYDIRVTDIHRVQIAVDGVTFLFSFIDYASDEALYTWQRALGLDEKHRYQYLMVFVVVYSIADRRTFDYAKEVLQEILEKRNDCNVLLIGSKCDLECREVSTWDGIMLARQSQCSFCETSALMAEAVEIPVFLARQHLRAFPFGPPGEHLGVPAAQKCNIA